MPTILGANSVRDTGYNVDNSCRFDGGDSDNLSRTNVSSVTNQFKWTFSFWVKLSDLETSRGTGNPFLFSDFTDSNNRGGIFFESDDTLRINDRVGGSTVLERRTNRKFRDTSAWYHIVVNHDRTVSSPTTEVYVNGVEEISFSATTNPSQNGTSAFNKASESSLIGKFGGGNEFFNGYIAEAVWIDGQALDSTSFGEFDDDSSSIWKPKDVSSLTFGNNGFYLDFEDSSNLGNDISGNSNDFTVNNLTALNQTTDTCTNNFATANLLLNTTPTYSDGNLTIATTNTNNLGGVSTIGVNTGKWYAEFKVIANATCAGLGIDSDPSESARLDASGEAYPGKYVTGYGYFFNGTLHNLGGLGEISYGDTFTTNDIIGIALDLDNNKLYFSKNGTFQNSGDPTSGATGTGAISITDPSSQPTGNYFFVTADGSRSRASTFSCNFGNPPYAISSGNSDSEGFGNFEYSVPSGYFALCTKNLAEYGG
jgi:hypothetical protein